MGLLSSVGDFLGFGGDTKVTVQQAAAQDINVSVNPTIRVDTASIGNAVGYGMQASADILSRSHEQFGKELGQGLESFGQSTSRSTLSLTSAMERQSNNEAEQILEDKVRFQWIQEKAGVVGKFLIVGGSIVAIYLLSKTKV